MGLGQLGMLKVSILTGLLSLVSPSNHDVLKSYAHNGFYYNYFSTPMSWAQAEIQCSQDGVGVLASLPDPALNQELVDLLDTDAWVGGRRAIKEDWVWLETGLELNIDIAGSVSSECAHLSVRDVGLHQIRGANIQYDLPCTTPLPYICDMPACSHRGTDKCLIMEQGSRAPAQGWQQARADCEAAGMNLTSLPLSLTGQGSNATKYTVLTHFYGGPVSPGRYWIGLHHVGWRWKTGQRVIFTETTKSWTIEDFGKNCLLLLQDGKWRPDICLENHPFICKTNVTRDRLIPGDTAHVDGDPSRGPKDSPIDSLTPVDVAEVKEKGPKPPTVVIALSVAAVVILCLLLAMAAMCIRRRKRRQRNTQTSSVSFSTISQGVAIADNLHNARISHAGLPNPECDTKSCDPPGYDDTRPSLDNSGSIFVDISLDNIRTDTDGETFENPIYYTLPMPRTVSTDLPGAMGKDVPEEKYTPEDKSGSMQDYMGKDFTPEEEKQLEAWGCSKEPLDK